MSLGSFVAEVFVKELIDLAMIQGSVDAETLAAGSIKFEAGVAARNPDWNEWEQSVTEFLRVVRILEHKLNIDKPCKG